MEEQLYSYLRSTPYEIGYLINTLTIEALKDNEMDLLLASDLYKI